MMTNSTTTPRCSPRMKIRRPTARGTRAADAEGNADFLKVFQFIEVADGYLLQPGRGADRHRDAGWTQTHLAQAL